MSLVVNMGRKRVVGNLAKQELGMVLGFGSLLGRSGIISIVILLFWWAIRGE